MSEPLMAVAPTTSGRNEQTRIDEIVARLDVLEDTPPGEMSGADILEALLDEDGDGSGLDADLLDGLDSTDFALAAHDHDALYEPLGAVAALVDSAPATLDTLNELAAALADDAAFATTVTTALGTKAPINNPTLTGTPAAPTAAASTDTTQIATTAFVKDVAAQVYFHSAGSYALTGGRFFIGTEDPSADGFTPANGDVWYDTT